MRLSLIRQVPAKVTFFTKASCGLCTTAKKNLALAWDEAKDKFEYEEIDITVPENSSWYDKYVRFCFLQTC